MTRYARCAKSSGHPEALTGLNRGAPFCTSGTNVLWNKCNWTVSNVGQTGACLIIGNLFSMSRSWMTAGGWNEHWHGMLEVAGRDDLLIYGMPLWQNCAGGRILGSGRLQPKTRFSGCSTSRNLSHFCICNIFVRSHSLCPKWVAAPWHTGAKSKSSRRRILYLVQFLSKLSSPTGAETVFNLAWLCCRWWWWWCWWWWWWWWRQDGVDDDDDHHGGDEGNVVMMMKMMTTNTMIDDWWLMIDDWWSLMMMMMMMTKQWLNPFFPFDNE